MRRNTEKKIFFFRSTTKFDFKLLIDYHQLFMCEERKNNFFTFFTKEKILNKNFRFFPCFSQKQALYLTLICATRNKSCEKSCSTTIFTTLLVLFIIKKFFFPHWTFSRKRIGMNIDELQIIKVVQRHLSKKYTQYMCGKLRHLFHNTSWQDGIDKLYARKSAIIKIIWLHYYLLHKQTLMGIKTPFFNKERLVERFWLLTASAASNLKLSWSSWLINKKNH